MEYLNEDAKKKIKKKRKGPFLYIRGRDYKIATSAKLLDTKYKLYEFNDDLIETIN